MLTAYLSALFRYEQEYAAAGEYSKYPSGGAGYPAPQHGQFASGGGALYRQEEPRGRMNGRYPAEYEEVRFYISYQLL